MQQLRLELHLQGESPRVLFPRGPMSVGRLSGNDLVLTDPLVSAAHLVFEPVGRGWQVRDLGSRNGTLVNGARCAVQPLRHGDAVTLGAATFQVRFVAALALPDPDVQLVPVSSEMVRTSIHGLEPHGFPPVDSVADAATLGTDYEKLRVAHELSLQLATCTEPDGLLAGVLEFCFRVLPVEHGAILLRNDAGKVQVHAARAALDDDPVRISRSLVDRVLNSGEALLLADAQQAAGFSKADSLHDAGIRAAIAVPLAVQGEARGVLFLDNCSQPHVFEDKDLHLVVGIAAQASLALERSSLLQRVERETERQVFLSRFLSPALVEEARADRLSLTSHGELRPVSVLFGDLRGFARMSERIGPEATVALLNEHFEHMVDVVFRFGGVLDKFVGDAFMATWGAPVRRDDDALRALRCGLALQERLASLAPGRAAAGLAELSMGVGVHSAEAVVGCIGAPMRLDYTVIGPGVNLSSRLCSLAQGGEVLASLETIAPHAEQLRFTEEAAVKVKGFAQATRVCRVEGENA